MIILLPILTCSKEKIILIGKRGASRIPPANTPQSLPASLTHSVASHNGHAFYPRSPLLPL